MGQVERRVALLPHCGLGTPYGDIVPGQNWTANGWQHQAITWINVDLSSVKSNDFHLMVISQDIHQPLITELSMKITYVNFHSNISWVNGLINTETTQVSIGRVTHATMVTIAMKSPDEVPSSGTKSIDTLTTIVVIWEYFS